MGVKLRLLLTPSQLKKIKAVHEHANTPVSWRKPNVVALLVAGKMYGGARVLLFTTFFHLEIKTKFALGDE